MSRCQNTSKPRQPRLRASCDGCFLAKVKCSKERPICSRCLTTGTECGYSPSSRAGKPKAVPLLQDTAPEVQSNDITTETYTGADNTYESLSSVPSSISTTFTLDSSSGLMSEPFGGRLHRRSISSISLSASQDEQISVATSSGSSINGFSPQFSWNLSPQLDTGNPRDAYHSGQRSKSTSAVPLLSPPDPWFQGQEFQDPFMNISPGPAMGFFPSDVYTPGFAAISSPDCDCFNNSLQSLQGLHQQAKCFDLSPSFDVVLTVNRRAVESCAAMLNCAQCMGKSSCNTTLMLLATIIGKVVYFYRAASQNYFGFTPGPDHQPQPQPLPLTFGSYKIPGEDGRWLEMEILLRELRKVEQVFMQFQDISKTDALDEHGMVYSAVVGHLRQNLNVTFEVLNMRRERG